MLKLTSAGKNGGRTFTLLNGNEEPFITKDLGEIAQHIVAEYPEIAESVIHDHQAKRELSQLSCDLGFVDKKDFLDELVECFCVEHGGYALMEAGDDGF